MAIKSPGNGHIPPVSSTSTPTASIGKISAKAGSHRSDPLLYDHPWPSMAEFAKLLALRYDTVATRHAYYRAVRLIHEHFGRDPATLSESEVRDYLLYVKTVKLWKPKTVRQSVAAARMFFVDLEGHADWIVFSQVRTKDHDELPVVLTREQVRQLLVHVRLRRYRIPLKLIYCCGLRISECLSLTIHDVRGRENKLWVRAGKGGRDRMVPIASPMVEDLRKYWAFHCHPLLLFPNVGQGRQTPEGVRECMHRATAPMPLELQGVPGEEFVKRYLRHVTPRGMHTIRYYGFCHPAAKKNRERIRFHTGLPLDFGASSVPVKEAETALGVPRCPCCHKPMKRTGSIMAIWSARGPP
jgi:integrase/recombinase XerD